MDLLTSMQVFVRAVEQGNLSGAAAACGMSATMAGNHLRALEQRLGMKLLNRTTRRQRLTAFGEGYYARCQEILRLVADSEVQAQNQQATPSGQLRITAPVSFGSEALVPALSEYMEAYPKVRIDLSLSDRTADLVDEGFDAAIRIGALPDSGLVARPLAAYRMLICASPAYLARRGIPTVPAELADHDCLSFSYSAGSPWRFRRAEDEVRVAVNGRLQINHGQALRIAALHGQGVVMQPAVLLDSDIQAGRLVRLFPDYELGSRPMHLVYLPDHRSPKLRSFVEFITRRFGEDDQTLRRA